MKILVLGGTGWLGHNIVNNLTAHGYNVTVGCRGKFKNFSGKVANVRNVLCDKNNEDDIKELLAENFPVVIDTVPTLKSIANIFKYGSGIRHYIHCSSTGGYTPLPFVPCNETAPYHGAAGGGWSEKAVCDAEIMRLFHVHGFPGTVIRPCYITGGDGCLPLDNRGGRRKDFLPDILAGKELEVPNDGVALLQPIHVEDLAESFRLALCNRNSIGNCYNICLDHALQFNKYLEINAEALGKKAFLKHVPLDDLVQKYPDEETGLRFVAQHMCFTIEKARRELGFIPAHHPEDTIAETAYLCAKKFLQ